MDNLNVIVEDEEFMYIASNSYEDNDAYTFAKEHLKFRFPCSENIEHDDKFKVITTFIPRTTQSHDDVLNNVKALFKSIEDYRVSINKFINLL